jgi:metal-dependent amidase/aminoacylase/carboxypeptidase family protein
LGATFAGLDQFTVELLGDQARPEVATRLKERLKALATVSTPTTPEQVSGYLSELRTPSGPLSRSLFVEVSSSMAEARVRLRVTLKADSDDRYPALRETVRAILAEELEAGTYELVFRGPPRPSMVSNQAVSERAAPALAKVVGVENVLTLTATHPFSGEDFALFLQEVPGAMFLLGVANAERGILGAPHFPDFDADEAAILVGTKAMSAVLWDSLSEE